MSSSEEEVRELVSLATLGEGILREADEHRILKVLLVAGFSPLEARERIDGALAATGARRAQDALPAPPPQREGGAGGARGAPEAAPPPVTGTDQALEKAITRSFKRRTRRSLGEAVGSGSRPGAVRSGPPGPERAKEPLLPEKVARPPEEEKPLGVCSVCLAAISHEDARAGRAEVLASGERHCRACLSKLRAGLLCKVCYKRVDRAELSDGRAQLHGDRAVHITCART